MIGISYLALATLITIIALIFLLMISDVVNRLENDENIVDRYAALGILLFLVKYLVVLALAVYRETLCFQRCHALPVRLVEMPHRPQQPSNH